MDLRVGEQAAAAAGPPPSFYVKSVSFRVLAVSAKFERKPMLQRHRLVNACLAEGLLHINAFEQKTLIPEQWARER
ncbi:hypothetical protein H8959_010741 [Pygathrix nigripes]